jgi:hypothetical protein
MSHELANHWRLCFIGKHRYDGVLDLEQALVKGDMVFNNPRTDMAWVHVNFSCFR